MEEFKKLFTIHNDFTPEEVCGCVCMYGGWT